LPRPPYSSADMEDVDASVYDPTISPGCVRSRVRELYEYAPRVRDAMVTVKVDPHGVRHLPVFRSHGYLCGSGVHLIDAEITLENLLSGPDLCEKCVPRALGPGSGFSQGYLAKTDLLANLANSHRGPEIERMRAIVQFIWNGNNNALPDGEYRRMVTTDLMPALKTYSAAYREHDVGDKPGTLVALTARDIHMGHRDNPEMYGYAITTAAQSTFYAAESNSVWLLNVRSWPGLGRFPGGEWALGTVLDDDFREEDMPVQAWEIFSTFCDDALHGAGNWANIRTFYHIAKNLSG